MPKKPVKKTAHRKAVKHKLKRHMLRYGTPVEYHDWYALWVKREDLSCPPPGPPFSKTRGVYAHVAKRHEGLIGVLDTYHSQAGHAVARACQVLGRTCINYYPEYKYEPGPREPQLRAQKLGAILVGLPAGRSAVLFHQAKKDCESKYGYMMPNALKLEESVIETAKEVPNDCDRFGTVIIPASSGTIAAGVIKGFADRGCTPTFYIHQGYSRSQEAMRKYILDKAGCDAELKLIDEGYAYKDKARPGETPPWPCNEYYDLKAFRWYLKTEETSDEFDEDILFWNIG